MIDMIEDIVLSGQKTKLEVDKRTRERFKIVKMFMRAKTHDDCLNKLLSFFLDAREEEFRRFMKNPDLRGYE